MMYANVTLVILNLYRLGILKLPKQNRYLFSNTIDYYNNKNMSKKRDKYFERAYSLTRKS